MDSTSAIVTGGGGGLGRAIAIRLAADGYAVAVVDNNEADATETCAEVATAGGLAQAFIVDLRDVDAIAEMALAVEAGLGPIEVLINNAGIFPAEPLVEVTPADYDDVIAVNQRAYFFAAQAVTKLMQARDQGGSIVNIGSITQHGGWGGMVPYVVTKGAAATLTRAMATELGPSEIRVNCVAPGAFPTRAEAMQGDPEAYSQRIIDSQALKRRGKLADVAGAVSFLVGPDASFITGQTLNVDGGWVMA